MLAPDDRTLLLDALRPPEGFELDHAVATTFTLDLDALLVAPLAFAMYDWITDTDGSPDPLALLEALRRYANRTTVFCQAGEVGFRAAYRPLVVLVENSVVSVAPPKAEKVFHPKLWVLRFVNETGGVRYRALVASRNLTFDRSWDTLLLLEGELENQPVAETAPLADLVRHLPQLAVSPLADGRDQAIQALADELERVRFLPPDGFDRLDFHLLGLGGGWPLGSGHDRALVVSPYLTTGSLDRIAGSGADHVLISSPEALDEVGRAGLKGYSSVYVLTPAALPADTDEAGGDDSPDEVVARPELDGLHAKVFLLERGDRAHLYTGSANATDAAFHGNVELLVELVGPVRDLGIDALLRPSEGEPSLRTLLEEAQPNDAAPQESTNEELARLDLDRLQRAIGRLAFTVRLQPHGQDFRATVTADGPVPGEVAELDELLVWPISRGAGHGVALLPRGDQLRADLGTISTDGITAFLAVRAALRRGDVEVATTFVVPAQLEGAPEGRSQRVLTAMLRNRDDLLRYLLFLLADADLDLELLLEVLAADQAGGAQTRLERVTPPLFETMLKALARNPGRLDHVASLIADLRTDEQGPDLLPEDFDEVWKPIWTVRQELRP